MKHNSIANDFTDQANIKIFGHNIALTLRSPMTTLCTVTFNIQEFYVYMDLRRKSDYFPVQNQLIGLCNRGMCFLRCTNCLCFELMSIFKQTIKQYVVSTQTGCLQSVKSLKQKFSYSKNIFFLKARQPQWVQASFMNSLDHTQKHHIRQDSSGRVISLLSRRLHYNVLYKNQQRHIIIEASPPTQTHHTQLDTPVRMIGPSHGPLPDNTQEGQTSMPPVEFERALPASERPKTHAVDRVATGISLTKYRIIQLLFSKKHTN